MRPTTYISASALLGIAAVGGINRVVERVSSDDPIIVDGERGEVHVRPSAEVIAVYALLWFVLMHPRSPFSVVREPEADARRGGLDH